MLIMIVYDNCVYSKHIGVSNPNSSSCSCLLRAYCEPTMSWGSWIPVLLRTWPFQEFWRLLLMCPFHTEGKWIPKNEAWQFLANIWIWIQTYAISHSKSYFFFIIQHCLSWSKPSSHYLENYCQENVFAWPDCLLFQYSLHYFWYKIQSDVQNALEANRGSKAAYW